jgi:hypothetical protein
MRFNWFMPKPLPTERKSSVAPFRRVSRPPRNTGPWRVCVLFRGGISCGNNRWSSPSRRSPRFVSGLTGLRHEKRLARPAVSSRFSFRAGDVCGPDSCGRWGDEQRFVSSQSGDSVIGSAAADCCRLERTEKSAWCTFPLNWDSRSMDGALLDA